MAPKKKPAAKKPAPKKKPAAKKPAAKKPAAKKPAAKKPAAKKPAPKKKPAAVANEHIMRMGEKTLLIYFFKDIRLSSVSRSIKIGRASCRERV